MTSEEIKKKIPMREFRFASSRSSGPGGQNVNKVSTRIELRFSVYESSSLSDVEKQKIISFPGIRINQEGVMK